LEVSREEVKRGVETMALELDSKFEKLIKGQATYKSANLGCNLLISRLQRKYSVNRSPSELQSCLQEINAFFEKYSSVMAKDIEALRSL